jgi:integrase
MVKRKVVTRGRSQHPGVKLKRRVRPGGADVWLARWVDPVTGDEREASLTALGLTNNQGRRAWAIAKASQLAEERQALALGLIAREGPRDVRSAVTSYLDRAAGRLRGSTIETYRESLDLLVQWCDQVGVRDLGSLDPPSVMRLRDWLVALPRQRDREKKRKGRPRSAMRVNRDIGAIKTLLLEARRHGRLPRLDREALGDGLRKLRAEQDQPEYLRSPELRQLLEAAMRHDAARFAMTRAEKAAGEAGGVTRHEAVAPLVLAAILTGCRIGELVSLEWPNVRLDGAGEIEIRAARSKTRRGRLVDLAVCPTLAQWLARLRLASGGVGLVFGITQGTADAARKHRLEQYGAPRFSWQRLRQTCATFLTCAPGIFGGASAYRSAAQLGHSVAVAERHYLGLLRDIPREARTLEAAMGIEDLAEQVATQGRLARAAVG